MECPGKVSLVPQGDIYARSQSYWFPTPPSVKIWIGNSASAGGNDADGADAKREDLPVRELTAKERQH